MAPDALCSDMWSKGVHVAFLVFCVTISFKDLIYFEKDAHRLNTINSRKKREPLGFLCVWSKFEQFRHFVGSKNSKIWLQTNFSCAKLKWVGSSDPTCLESGSLLSCSFCPCMSWFLWTRNSRLCIVLVDFCVGVLWLQEAIKCMRHSKRTTLTADDVESALKLRNVEVNFFNYDFVFASFFLFIFIFIFVMFSCVDNLKGWYLIHALLLWSLWMVLDFGLLELF